MPEPIRPEDYTSKLIIFFMVKTPRDIQIAEATGLALSKIDKMRGYLVDQSYSLDRTISDEDGRKFIDMMQDESLAAKPAE